jgi:hypothetical protein
MIKNLAKITKVKVLSLQPKEENLIGSTGNKSPDS